MKKFFLFFLLLWAFIIQILAQLPNDFRTEQIFLCPKKTEWTSSDTIELEGQVTCLAGNRVLPYSKYLYIEWINNKDSVLTRQKVSCKDKGYFKTKIPQDPTNEAGVYYLRAYTNLMRNFSSSSFALQPILINQSFPKQSLVIDEEVLCHVYPSGGKLAPNTIQSVTTYLTDYLGNPLRGQKLSLIKNQKDTISEAITTPSGMACLYFIPQEGAKYNIAFISGKFKKTFELPPINTSSIKIQGSLNGKQLYYELQNCHHSIDNYKLYLYHRELGISKINLEKTSRIITFPQPPYFTTLFLTDKNENILSEHTFCGKTKTEPLTLPADTIRTGEAVLLHLPNSLKESRIFMRLTDTNSMWESHAASALQYETDLASPIPFPKFFFQETEAQRNTDLQSWINTVKFKRFNLKDVLQNGKDIYTFMPEENIVFSGKIENDSHKPIKKGFLVAYNNDNNLVYDTTLDSNGRFQIATDDFNDGTSFFLQATNAQNKPIRANIIIDDETYPPVSIQHTFFKKAKYVENIKTSIEGSFQNQTLPNVVVKARLRTEKPKPTNKFYSTNYADREEIEKHNYNTLEEILKNMPGIKWSIEESHGTANGSANIHFYSSRGESTLMRQELPIIIDGVKLDSKSMQNCISMPAFEIEEVELLRPWQAIQYTPGAIDGAILVKTRKSLIPPPSISKGTYYTPLGLSGRTKEEASPLKAPNTPGTYRLLIDIISPLNILSFEKEITVIE